LPVRRTTDSMEASGDYRCNLHVVVAWVVYVSWAECIQSFVIPLPSFDTVDFRRMREKAHYIRSGVLSSFSDCNSYLGMPRDSLRA
jgi:hypothetical protein